MSTTTAADMVAAATRGAETLTPEEFGRRSRRDGAVVVDVRESDERTVTGSIPGAVHVPRGMLEFRADPTHPLHDPRLDPAAEVLVYCAAGARSALAVATLHQLGYQHVAHLQGGIGAWIAGDLPVVGRVDPPY